MEDAPTPQTTDRVPLTTDEIYLQMILRWSTSAWATASVASPVEDILSSPPLEKTPSVSP